MNECLLVKWIRKIYQEPNALWFKILKAKYLGDKSFFDSKTRGLAVLDWVTLCQAPVQLGGYVLGREW